MGSTGAIKIEAEVGVRRASHRALCCCGLGEDLRRREEEKGDRERGRRKKTERGERKEGVRDLAEERREGRDGKGSLEGGMAREG